MIKKHLVIFIIITLIVASLAAFGRIAGNGFINFDDIYYITENNYIQSGFNSESVKWTFTTVLMGNWHPLTWLSHMLDWSLFGANAFGHHLVNILLHIGAVIFLFLFLNKTTNNLWTSAFAAAFFALHPLRVESVAWAAERKDVLSMFFGIAGVYAYAFYAEKPNPSKYLLCLTLFMMALMSKPMLVSLPFVLMLFDYWPLKRWPITLAEKGNRLDAVAGLLWEKIPFIILTIVFSLLTLWAQNKAGAISASDNLSFFLRFNNSIISYSSYLEKIFLPGGLAVFYPYDFSLSLWKAIFSGLFITIITAAVVYFLKKLPFLFVGWFLYVGTLIPVIGLIQAGSQAMADRYTYLPSIGITIMAAWGMPLLFQRLGISKKILFSAAIAILFTLSFLTWMQCGYWKNDFDLFNHTLKITKNNYLAHNNLGLALFSQGKNKEAIEHYNEAMRINPHYVYAYNNRGIIYGKSGQDKLALDDFNEAIRRMPVYAEAYNNRGFTFSNMRQYQRAIDDYSKAIRIKPDYAEAYMNRGVVYLKQGNNTLGCHDAQKACQLGNCKTLESAKDIGLCR